MCADGRRLYGGLYFFQFYRKRAASNQRRGHGSFFFAVFTFDLTAAAADDALYVRVGDDLPIQYDRNLICLQTVDRRRHFLIKGLSGALFEQICAFAVKVEQNFVVASICRNLRVFDMATVQYHAAVCQNEV